MSDFQIDGDTSYERLKNLRRERLELFNRTSALAMQSADECRDLTASEQSEYTSAMLSLELLNKRIESEQEQAKLELARLG